MQKALTAYCKSSPGKQGSPPMNRKKTKSNFHVVESTLKTVMEENKKSLQKFCRERMEA